MLHALQNRRRHSADAGFTLIELLMVIIILGVLAGIVVFSVRGIDNKAEANACKTERSTVATAAEARYAEKGGPYADVATLVSEGRLHDAPTKSFTIDATTGAVSDPC